MLSFHNTKIQHLQEALGVKCASFDLPCGLSCPYAKDCRTTVVELDNKRVARKDGKFMCYAAKAEMQYSAVFMGRRVNFHVSKSSEFMGLLIQELRIYGVKVLRIHSSGDFYNTPYYNDWRTIVKTMPDVDFFGYTKNLHVMRWTRDDPLPNLHLIYSWGGVDDAYAKAQRVPTCYVAFKDEYDGRVPVIDSSINAVDDYNYIKQGQSFAIRFH